MEEESLILGTIESILGLYQDYSGLRYDQVRSEINRKLHYIHENLRSLLEIPPIDIIEEHHLTLEAFILNDQASYGYICEKTPSQPALDITDEFRHEKSFDHEKSNALKRVRSLLTQIKANTDGYIPFICDRFIEMVDSLQQLFSKRESDLLTAVTDLFIYHHTFEKQIHRPIDSPLQLNSNDQRFSTYYETMLREVNKLDSRDMTVAQIETRLQELATAMITAYKAASNVYYFFDLNISVLVHKSVIELVQVLSDDESSEIRVFIKDFFESHPLLPELSHLKAMYAQTSSKGSDTVPKRSTTQQQQSELRQKPELRSPADDIDYSSAGIFDRCMHTLIGISREFKTYELYYRKSDEPDLPEIDNNYYEFRFPQIFGIYVKTIQAEMDDYTKDAYFRAVCSEVLKYENIELTPECWDLALHGLCKLMFSETYMYESLPVNAYHRFAVLSFAKSQSFKRSYFSAWKMATFKHQEFKSLSNLFNKAVKKSMLSRWIEKFIDYKSMSAQAERYKNSYDRNLAFSKWFYKRQDISRLDQIANDFILNKYFVKWLSKRSIQHFNAPLVDFKLLKKAYYFSKMFNKYKAVKQLEKQGNQFIMAKAMRLMEQKMDALRVCTDVYQTSMLHKHFHIWRNSQYLMQIKSEAHSKRNSCMKRWMFLYWHRRMQESVLSKKFRQIRNGELVKDRFYNMLLVCENNELSREFRRRKLLQSHFYKMQLALRLKKFESVQNILRTEKYFKIFKGSALCSLFQASHNQAMVRTVLRFWKDKRTHIDEQRSIRLKAAYETVFSNFQRNQKKVYLKVFLYKWEEATIDCLQKAEILRSTADRFMFEKAVKMHFDVWKLRASKLARMKMQALEFDRTITTAIYLGVMLDRFDQVEFLNEREYEFKGIFDSILISRLLKKWFMRSLKIKTSTTLVEQFQKRSDAAVLRSFFYLWKDSRLEKQASQSIADDSFDSSMMYSPLLHRYPGRSTSSNLWVNNHAGDPTTSTPLLHRNTSFNSPARTDEEGSFMSRRSPRKVRTPRKAKPESTSLNSESFRRVQAAELRTRYQGLGKSKNTGDRSRNSQSPPVLPKFYRDGTDSENNDVAVDSDAFFTPDQKSNVNVGQAAFAIPEPKISPNLLFLNKLKESSGSMADATRSRSSSLTFVDRSSANVSQDDLSTPTADQYPDSVMKRQSRIRALRANLSLQ